MLRRCAALLAFGAGIFAVLILLDLLIGREPRYDGRSLSEWLTRLAVHTETDRPPYPDAAERERAHEAISRIGTKALPYLTRWI